MGMIPNLFIKTGNDYSLAVICTESIYQLVYFRLICHKLKLIDVITIPTLHPISHDQGNYMLRIAAHLKSSQLRSTSLYIRHD